MAIGEPPQIPGREQQGEKRRERFKRCSHSFANEVMEVASEIYTGN
jgi:hypothetical protein